MELTQAQLEAIVELYIAYFNRAPETAGLDFHVQAVQADLATGLSFEEALDNRADNFFEAAVSMPEQTGYSISQPTSDFVRTIYENTLLRPGAGGEAPTDAEVGYWVAQLESGAVSRGEMISQFIADTKFLATNGTPEEQAIASEVVAVLENRVEVGLYFARPEVSGGLTGEAAYEAGVAALVGVDETQESVDAAIDRLEDSIIEGNTINLTDDIDNLAGTEDNDTFLGALSNVILDQGTLQSGDTLDGKGGDDTLVVTATASAVGPVVPTLTDIEKVETRAFSVTGPTVINLANSTGVETVASANGTTAVRYTGVSNLVAAEISNTLGGNFRIDYTAAAVAGTDDTQSVMVDNAQVNNINLNGALESVAIDAVGMNMVNGLNTNNSVDDLTVTGDGSLAIASALNGNINTVDASANTGGVTLDVSNHNDDLMVTGGTGDDAFNVGFLTADDMVDGGDGEDTVTVTNSGNLSSAAAAAPFNALTGVERVEFNTGGPVTLNGATFTNAEITNLLFNSVGDDIINNAGSARTYEFGTDNSGNATFNMKVGSTELNIDLVASATMDANVDDVTVNLAGAEPAGTKATINVNSTGPQENDIDIIDAVAGSTVNITGDAENTEIDGFVNNVVVDASALTGDLTIGGSDYVLPGVGDPVTQGVDTITLGSGMDEVEFFTGASSGILSGTNILVDTIIGFQAGADGDVLEGFGSGVYTALAPAAQASIDALSGGGATLQAAADIAAGANTAGEWTAFSFAGQTYAYLETGAESAAFDDGDVLVALTGVAVADLTQDNFF